MASICGTSLFGQSSQYIKPGNGEFVAIEGSGVVDRLPISDLRMPYKQLLRGRIILKACQVNYLLNHLGLGDNATFLAIKATYDPKSVVADNNYISYSYYNNPVQNLTFSQMLVLTGNSAHRIPQLYLTNPNCNYNVFLDVMVGIIDENYSFFNDDLNQNATSFTGLEYTDIKSFVVGESVVVYDKGSPKRALIYFGLPYINSINLNSTFLIIDDESFGTVFLNFIDEFNAKQAYSLMNYVLENPNIDIDTISPLLDDIPPVVYWNSTAGATGSYIVNYLGLTSSFGFNTENDGLTFSTSISLSNWGTSSILYKDKLRDLVIDYIDDIRDGEIGLMDSEMIITGTAGVVNSISTTGTYSLTFNVGDLAQNNLNGVVMNLNIII
jgi:hypothetical protein